MSPGSGIKVNVEQFFSNQFWFSESRLMQLIHYLSTCDVENEIVSFTIMKIHNMRACYELFICLFFSIRDYGSVRFASDKDVLDFRKRHFLLEKTIALSFSLKYAYLHVFIK